VSAPPTPSSAERATYDLDARTGARALDSIVLRGDLSGLGPAERAAFYTQMCEGLGLNPHAQPFAFLRLNGKEILYATRGATDQLAAMHRVTREIIDGPKVIDLAGTKLVYAVCKASLPGGRFETATATVPLRDLETVLMKVETKAKRRATLSLLGLGVLDELEVESIPQGAREEREEAHAEPSIDLNADLRAETLPDVSGRPEASRDVPPPSPTATPAASVEPVSPAVVALLALAGAVASPEAAVALWVEHRATLSQAKDRERITLKKALARRVSKVGPAGLRSLTAAEDFLRREIKRALDAADAASASAATPAVAEVREEPANDPLPHEGDEAPTPLAAFYARVQSIELPGEAVAVFRQHRAALGELDHETRTKAFRDLCDHVERVGRMSNARVWLKKAIAEADAQSAAAAGGAEERAA